MGQVQLKLLLKIFSCFITIVVGNPWKTKEQINCYELLNFTSITAHIFISWSEVIRHNLRTLGLVEDMAQDRILWRARIKVADF